MYSEDVFHATMHSSSNGKQRGQHEVDQKINRHHQMSTEPRKGGSNMSKEKFTAIAQDQSPDNGVDRIRQILFGEQIGEIERRFEMLEERLAEESLRLRHELNQRLDQLGAELRKEIQSISAELEDDGKKRDELSELFASISLSLKGKSSHDQDFD